MNQIEKLKKENEKLRMLLSDKVMEDSPITDSYRIAHIYINKLALEKQEYFYCVLLDNKHNIVDEVMVSKGILNRSLVHPREVFAPAIEQRCAAIILVHNHPSGCTKPSTQDIDITKRMVSSGEILGIKVLDHIVVSHLGFYSFNDEGLI